MARTRGHDTRPRDRYRKRESASLTAESHTKATNARKKSLRVGDYDGIPLRLDFTPIASDLWP
jgi:hypothetical protein